MPTLRRRQSSPLCVAVLLCVVAACDFVFGLNLLFTAPAAQVSVRRQAATGPSPVSLRAREVDEEEVLFNFNKKKKKGYDPNWERPFPRYIVGGGIFLTIVGFFGGGPTLAAVWGLCGAGFGCLLEPWQTPDGEISGLYFEEDDE